MSNEKQTETAAPPLYGEVRLTHAIDQWVDKQVREGFPVPDFWDECSTSEQLSAYLWAAGYRKV